MHKPILIRKESNHPFKPVSIYRAYEVQEDGSLFPMYLANENRDALRSRIRDIYGDVHGELVFRFE